MKMRMICFSSFTLSLIIQHNKDEVFIQIASSTLTGCPLILPHVKFITNDFKIKLHSVEYSNKSGEKMLDPEKIMESVLKETDGALKAMKKAKTAEEKLVYSKITKNLCESLGVFIELVHTMGAYDGDDVDAPF